MTAEAACEQTSIREGLFGYGGGCTRGSEYICGPGNVSWKFSSFGLPRSLSPFYYHPFVLSKGLFKFTSLYVYASSAYDQFALLTAQIYN